MPNAPGAEGDGDGAEGDIGDDSVGFGLRR